MKYIKKLLVLVFVALSSLAVSASGEDRQAKVRPKPLYPEVAKRMHLSGAVKIEVTITPAGSVKSTKVIGGHPLLVESALDAIKRWKYEPANDETVQVETINFSE